MLCLSYPFRLLSFPRKSYRPHARVLSNHMHWAFPHVRMAKQMGRRKYFHWLNENQI